MMNRKSILAIVLLVMSSTACASLNSVSITPIPTDRSRQVFAEAMSTTFLGIALDNSFVDTLVADLSYQCPHGKVKGILTYFENTVYFVIVERRVQATGYCVVDVQTTMPKTPENEPNL